MTQLENLRRPDGLATYDDNDNDHWSEFHHEVAEIEEDTAHIIHDLRVIKEIGAFYVFALIARFYKTWTGIPALNTFARTIEVAFFKLLSFLFLATCLLAMGPRYISSAEVSLLILLESVLAPLLVWAWIGEGVS